MKEEILDILTQIRPEFDFVSSEDYISDGLLDSFDIVSLVDSLDEKYNISISGIDIIPENFSSLDAIVRTIKNNKKSSPK